VARVAGLVYDELSFLLTGAGCQWLTRGLLAGWKKRKFAERKAREAFYDGVNPAQQDLRAFDPQNFHYPANDIVRLGFRFNNSSEIASATGTILLTTFDGPTRTLTAINYIQPAVVIKLLRSIDSTTRGGGRTRLQVDPPSRASGGPGPCTEWRHLLPRAGRAGRHCVGHRVLAGFGGS
jgi:hypothetical protein